MQVSLKLTRPPPSTPPPAAPIATGVCDPTTWPAVKGSEICTGLAPCTALIDFSVTGATSCGQFCAAQELSCDNAADEKDDHCMVLKSTATAVTCDTIIGAQFSNDVICYCSDSIAARTRASAGGRATRESGSDPLPKGWRAPPWPAPVHRVGRGVDLDDLASAVAEQIETHAKIRLVQVDESGAPVTNEEGQVQLETELASVDAHEQPVQVLELDMDQLTPLILATASDGASSGRNIIGVDADGDSFIFSLVPTHAPTGPSTTTTSTTVVLARAETTSTTSTAEPLTAQLTARPTPRPTPAASADESGYDGTHFVIETDGNVVTTYTELTEAEIEQLESDLAEQFENTLNQTIEAVLSGLGTLVVTGRRTVTEAPYDLEAEVRAATPLGEVYFIVVFEEPPEDPTAVGTTANNAIDDGTIAVTVGNFTFDSSTTESGEMTEGLVLVEEPTAQPTANPSAQPSSEPTVLPSLETSTMAPFTDDVRFLSSTTSTTTTTTTTTTSTPGPL